MPERLSSDERQVYEICGLVNHKERVRAVLSGEQVDRPPVATWGHDFLREWRAEDLAAHTIERQRKYDYDFVKLNPRWTMFAEPWGNEYEPPTEQRFPRLTKKIVSSVDDLPHVPRVTAEHPVFQQHVDALRMVVDEIGDDVDVLVTIFSPLSVLGLLCGGVGQPLLTYAQEAPEQVHENLRHITDTLTAHVSALMDAGAAGVFYAALQWTSLEVCSDEFYREFGRPYDEDVLAASERALFNMFHVCGNHIDLPRFFDYPVHAFNWDNFGPGNTALAEASRQTDKVVAAGIPHRKIHKMDSEEMSAVASKVLEGAGANVMLAGGCGIGATVADDIRAAVTHIADSMKR